MSLRELYQEMIIDHGRHPRNFGCLENATHCKQGHNPLCGDQLTLHIIEKNKMVFDLKFEGIGCAISMASASLMTEAVKGKKISEVETLFEDFHCLVTQGKVSEENLGKLEIFAGVFEFPVRVKCATLAWHTLKAALLNNNDPISTE